MPDIFFMTYKDWKTIKDTATKKARQCGFSTDPMGAVQRMIDEVSGVNEVVCGVRQQPAETERRPDRVRSVRFSKLRLYDLAEIEKGIGPDWFWHHPHARPAWLKKHRPKKRFRGLFFYVAPKHRPAKSSKP